MTIKCEKQQEEHYQHLLISFPSFSGGKCDLYVPFNQPTLSFSSFIIIANLERPPVGAEERRDLGPGYNEAVSLVFSTRGTKSHGSPPFPPLFFFSRPGPHPRLLFSRAAARRKKTFEPKGHLPFPPPPPFHFFLTIHFTPRVPTLCFFWKKQMKEGGQETIVERKGPIYAPPSLLVESLSSDAKKGK